MISARIIADSVSPNGKRIITFVLRYPRLVHADFMTHRLFSRNAASSRAIPVHKYIKQVLKEPVMPVWWGRNQAGMQAEQELIGPRKWLVMMLWLLASKFVVAFAWLMSKVGLHKQIANRILEPWYYIETICTATELGNFFNLRAHPAAQPEIQKLARKMLCAMRESKPIELAYGEWHLPFVSNDEIVALGYPDALRVSVARCARVSYLNHDGKRSSVDEDIKLYNRLLAAGHVSPFEHQAMPLANVDAWSGNFRGWLQYRKTIPNEHRSEYDYAS